MSVCAITYAASSLFASVLTAVQSVFASSDATACAQESAVCDTFSPPAPLHPERRTDAIHTNTAAFFIKIPTFY